MNRVALALAASLAAVVFAPVTAAVAEDRHTVVQHNDLDLSTVAGRAELRERIDSAIDYVCRDNPTRQLAVRAQCEAQAREGVMSQSDSSVRAALSTSDTEQAGRAVTTPRAAPL